MNRRLAAVCGSALFTATWELGLWAAPGPMPSWPALAGVVAPAGVALLWMLAMSTYNGDDAIVHPYTPAAQRRPANPAREREVAR